MSDEARERWMSIAAAFDALIAQIDTTIDLAEHYRCGDHEMEQLLRIRALAERGAGLTRSGLTRD